MSSLEPPPDSPRRGLSKLRRNRKDGDKSRPISTLGLPQEESNGGFRASIDGALEKLKDRTRKSIDDRRTSTDSNSNSTSNSASHRSKRSLQLPRRSRDKNRSKNDVSQDAKSDQVTGRDISPSPSELSIGIQGSGHSSLLTEDSDHDVPPRPTLSAHSSHAGYLTLSSPLIKAQATTATDPSSLADTSALDTLEDNTAALDVSLHPIERRPVPSDRSTADSALPKKDVRTDNNLHDDSSSNVTKHNSNVTNSTETLPRAITEQTNSVSKVPFTPKTTLTSPKPLLITSPATPPITVEPPITLVTPPTPVFSQRPFSPQDSDSANAKANTPASSSTTSLNSPSGHRRKKTGTFTSSKLSNSITAFPLTPHIEEAKTPGGTLTAPSGTAVGALGSAGSNSGGFFSSVFSAAQNAANQLTNTINTSITQNQKNKPPQIDKTEPTGGEEVTPGPEDHSQIDSEPGARRQLAVETLGKGDLSLSHLGISEESEVSPMTSQIDLPRALSPAPSTIVNSAEENAAARAVSNAYEKPVKDSVAQATGGRPGSVISADGHDAGVRTPPRSNFTLEGLGRSGSVRSKGGDRRRRTRGSSAATANTLAAAIASTSSTLVNPTVNGHRLTGFAVASSKRNKEFHQLFRSVPEDDYLIEDYSAALQRDILLHGRLYVSEGHICFSSNILGWVTNLVISFDEVVSVEKKSTAVIFPNAIVIQTLHARNIFASLVARDSTYDLLIGIWKISHPNLKSSLNGIAIDDAGTSDKTEKAGSIASLEDEEDASDDEVYDEDEDEDDTASFYEPTTAGSAAGSEIGDGPVSRKPSAAPVALIPGQPISASLDHTPPTAPLGQPAGGADFPGPSAHPATECTDEASHYPSKLTDTTIPAPLGKVYSLMFGPQSSTFMKTFLIDNQKSRELDFTAPPGGLDNSNKEFVYSYIKPLNAPVGPRQTKCIVTAKLEDFDLEKAVSIGCSTATPDVPSGGVFETKTRYCLMWGPNNSTRFVASCTVEWSGKSWLKGPIEKGANDGQIQYVKDLVAALRSAVVVVASAPLKPGKKGRSRRKDKEVAEQASAVETIAQAKAETQANWGLFEPVRPILEPVSQILGPMLSSQLIIGVLLVLLMSSWFWPARRSTGIGYSATTPDRLVAYEEIWRREESDLWDWLEDRVGLQNGMPVAGYADSDRLDRQKVLAMKAMRKRLDTEDKLMEGQVEDAIRVTEDRLGALKEAIRRRKDQS